MDNNYLDIKLCLDMLSSKTQASIPMSKGDTNVRFLISFSNNSEAYRIPDGVWAILSVKPESNLVIEPYSCTIIDESTVVFIPDGIFASAEGFNEVEVTLYDGKNGGRALTSPRFSVYIDDKINVGNIPVFKGDEIATFGEIFANEETRKSNEKLRDEAENGTEDTIGRVQAEEARESAENKRVQAEEARESEENERVQAEKARESAENERVEAENARESAENKRVEAENARAQKFSNNLNLIVEEAKVTIENVTNENLSKAIVTIEEKADSVLKETDARLTNIENHINPKFFLTDNNVSYYKYVPEKNCPNARLNYIGGRSGFGDNLSPVDITVDTSFSNANLASVTVDEKQLYLLNPDSDKTEIYVRKDSNGGEILYIISGETNVYLETGVYYFTLERKGELNESIVVSPIIKRFYPDTKVTAVNVLPPNLLPFPYTSQQPAYSEMDGDFTYTTSTGIDIEVKKDRSITLTLCKDKTDKSTTIYLRTNASPLSFERSVYVSGAPQINTSIGYLAALTKGDNDLFKIFAYDYGDGFEVSQGTAFVLAITINAGVTFGKLTFNPRISFTDDKSREYEIPEEITSLPGYGQSNPNDASEYNYIDCKKQKFVTKGLLVDNVWVKSDTPKETTIAFDKFIEIETGDNRAFEFVNDSEGAVPSSISYLLKED